MDALELYLGEMINKRTQTASALRARLEYFGLGEETALGKESTGACREGFEQR